MSKRPLTVEAHQGLVRSIANRYVRICRHLSIEDLHQEGNLGLLIALERFDPTRGVQFSSYATWWIRQAIRRSIQNTERTIRLPCHLLERLHRAGELKSERTASFEARLSEDGACLADVMPCQGESPEDACERHEREALARALLDELEPRERTVIESRFFDDRTLAQIGDALPRPVSRERIRQVETLALAKMRRIA